MYVYCETDNPSQTLKRIVSQVKQTAPLFTQFVPDPKHADVAIILTIGTHGIKELMEQCPSVILQLCYKTGGPAEFWSDAWQEALLV